MKKKNWSRKISNQKLRPNAAALRSWWVFFFSPSLLLSAVGRYRLALDRTEPGQELLLLLELLLQHLTLQAQLLLLAGQLLTELGRLAQYIHLGRPLLVPNIGYLLLERLEQVLESDATLALHIVVLIPLLDRIGLVQAELVVAVAVASTTISPIVEACGGWAWAGALALPVVACHWCLGHRRPGAGAGGWRWATAAAAANVSRRCRRRCSCCRCLLAATLFAQHRWWSRMHDPPGTNAVAAAAGHIQVVVLASLLAGGGGGNQARGYRARAGARAAGAARRVGGVHAQRRVRLRGGGAILVRCARGRWITRIGHRLDRTTARRRIGQIVVAIAGLFLIHRYLVGHLGLQGAHYLARGIVGQLLVRIGDHVDFLICKMIRKLSCLVSMGLYLDLFY